MGHLLLSWMSAHLGFPIWKWFLWKTSHCCWLPVMGVRWTEGQEGSEPLNNKPQKFPGVCQVKVTEQSYLSLARWQNISLVITLTISTCSASLWKTKPSVLLVQGIGSCLSDTQRTSPRHHRDFQCEQIPVSEQATVTFSRKTTPYRGPMIGLPQLSWGEDFFMCHTIWFGAGQQQVNFVQNVDKV